MNQQLDIVRLIESSPISRLKNEYQNRLLTRIKETFSDTQQQLFITNFYCYLNHNCDEDFIVNLDSVWKWVGFSRKDNAVKVFKKHFIKDVDYYIVKGDEKPAPQVGGAGLGENTSFASPTGGAGLVKEKDLNSKRNTGGSGLNKETIMMTVNTFKKFCMKACTKKADEIHNYYIKLEQLLNDALYEQSSELSSQLDMTKSKLSKLEESHNRLLYKRRRHQLKKGRCFYILKNQSQESSYKFGITDNLNSRRSTYHTHMPEECDFVYINFTWEHRLIENCVRRRYRNNQARSDCEWLINVDIDEVINFVERLSVDLHLEYKSHTNMDEIIDEDEQESNDIEEEQTPIQSPTRPEYTTKTCIKCSVELSLDNFHRDKTKKDGYHGVCKTCAKETKIKYITAKQANLVPLTEKKCGICNQVKDISCYSKHLYNKDGYVNNCHECCNKYTRDKRKSESDNGIRYKCGRCDKDYCRKDLLTKHQKTCSAIDI